MFRRGCVRQPTSLGVACSLQGCMPPKNLVSSPKERGSPAEEVSVSTAARQQLVQQLAALELQERDVSAARKMLHRRVAIFPSGANRQAERHLSAYRGVLHRAIDAANASLVRNKLP